MYFHIFFREAHGTPLDLEWCGMEALPCTNIYYDCKTRQNFQIENFYLFLNNEKKLGL